MRRDPDAGPIFGENDLYIGNHIDGSAVSFSDLGHAYELPDNSFEVGSLDARTFLAGSYKFIPDNIEVFHYFGMSLYIPSVDRVVRSTISNAAKYYCSL